jgi:hypothetical protein
MMSSPAEEMRRWLFASPEIISAVCDINNSGSSVVRPQFEDAPPYPAHIQPLRKLLHGRNTVEDVAG